MARATVLLLVVVLAACVPGHTPSASSPSSSASASPTSSPTLAGHTIEGSVSLPEADSTHTGSTCEAGPFYDDIKEGAQIFVKDENGMIIGTASLEVGLWVDSLSLCTFQFTVLHVPDSALYVVEPSSRAGKGLYFSRAELEAHTWRADMTFGG